MLPDILLKSIEKVTTEVKTLNKTEINNFFVPYFRDPKKQMVYPSSISRNLNISIDEAFILLNSLMEEGVLEKVYEFRCPDTDYRELFRGESYINLPVKIICEDCGEEFILRDNLYVIYEVKKSHE